MMCLVGWVQMLRAGEVTTGTWNFGAKAGEPQAIAVMPDASYSPDRGYGFDLKSSVDAGMSGPGDAAIPYCTSDKAFYFSVAVPEGDYSVSVSVVGAKDSWATLKAESRRLMVEHAAPAAGQVQVCTFSVNVRTPNIAGGDAVRLRAGENHALDWDDKLTLEFSGAHPRISAVHIEPLEKPVTVYIAGDSTVTDQEDEPYNSWGQMLPRFFKPGIVVANYAKSGETAGSFIGDHRLAKIDSLIKPGDYLLIQFSHNDMKAKGPDAGAFKDFTAHLKTITAVAKAHGAQAVLITPMNRRSFDKQGKITNTFRDYPDAIRKLAADEKLPLIDLQVMSKSLYEALGVDGAVDLFALPENGRRESTHHNDYGSYELAKCIVLGIGDEKISLAKWIVDDWKGFDPSKPDPAASFTLPKDPEKPTTKPEGN
jgi:lysophospholipase L1-like esterase